MFDEVMQDTTAEIESETSFDYDNLFEFNEEDFEEETTEETTEEDSESDEEAIAEKDGETEGTTEETTEEEETVDFKFFGQTSKLSKPAIEKIGQGLGKNAEEVVALLQKGTNYEHSPLHKLIDKYAEANGMNREEYVKFLENGLPGLAENIQRNKIQGEHPDWDDEKVNLAVQLNLSKLNTAKAEREEREKKAAEQEAFKPHLEFLAKYPDVKQYPDEVAKDIEKGVSPIVAYESYMQRLEYQEKLNELNKKIAKETQKQKNKAKSTGSLKDSDEGSEKDWFAEGLGY